MKKIIFIMLLSLVICINLFSADIIRAYPRGFNALDIVYDEPMSSVNPNNYTLTGTATITFSGAAIDGSDNRIVNLTGGSPGMITDTILDTINDNSSLPLVFYTGPHTIPFTNTSYSETLLNGYYVTLYGKISANDGENNVWVSGDSGDYDGVLINSNSFDDLVDIGDGIVFNARRNEIDGNTVLESPLLLYPPQTDAPYEPESIEGSEIDETLPVNTDPGEKWEGQLVKIENVYIESYVNYDYRCTSDGGTTHFHVGDRVDNQFGSITMNVGSSYNIVGVVDWDNNNGNYRINPRDADDITSLGILPENLIITVNGNDIDLIWTKFYGATSYNIYRSTDPYNFGTIVHDSKNTNSYKDVGAAGDVKYFYKVTAVY